MIRDFIAGQRLENGDSRLNVAQIEADANHDEYPPWHNADNAADWSVYLTLRTTAVFQLRRVPVAQAPPNAASGNWRGL